MRTRHTVFQKLCRRLKCVLSAWLTTLRVWNYAGLVFSRTRFTHKKQIEKLNAYLNWSWWWWLIRRRNIYSVRQWFPTGGSRPESGSRRSFCGEEFLWGGVFVGSRTAGSKYFGEVSNFQNSVYQDFVLHQKNRNMDGYFVEFTLFPL